MCIERAALARLRCATTSCFSFFLWGGGGGGVWVCRKTRSVLNHYYRVIWQEWTDGLGSRIMRGYQTEEL